MLILAILFLIIVTATYPKWSWKKWAERSEIHVKPYSGEYKE